MPFKSESQRRWMYANKPSMAKRWQKHTPKGKLPARAKKSARVEQLAGILKQAFDMGPLADIGSGLTRIVQKFTPEKWSFKLNQLRTRAALGDQKATELLSIIGVASVVLGSASGMAAGRAIGGGIGRDIGGATGALLGVSPILKHEKLTIPKSDSVMV